MRPRIADLATEIVDAVIERGECDFVADVAGELPSYVIDELLDRAGTVDRRQQEAVAANLLDDERVSCVAPVKAAPTSLTVELSLNGVHFTTNGGCAGDIYGNTGFGGGIPIKHRQRLLRCQRTDQL